jgi:hypothetical protein
VEQDDERGVQMPVRRTNWTIVALIAGAIILALLIAYVAINKNGDQDKLTNAAVSEARESNEKACASKPTYDLIKRELFRRAAQLRGSDQAAYDRLATYAVIRMENPVMESEDSSTGAVNCSGSLSLDLPPDVAVVGGRHSLTADVDYTVQPAADRSGNVVLLRNADPIIAPLATLARSPTATQPSPEEQVPILQPVPIPAPAPGSPPEQAPASPPPPPPAAPSSAKPSFNCADARSRSEIAVCSDSGLAALDRNMAAQFNRALDGGSPDQQALLRRTRDRFLAYRNRCPDRRCIADAYVGRMREIRDIVEGRWRAPR